MVNSGMQRILIGCPVHRREWIIEKWLDHTVTAARYAELEPVFIFVGDENDPTMSFINHASKMKEVQSFLHHEPDNQEAFRRSWPEDRLRRMVYLRNILLTRVREYAPEYFLSLDSDILLHAHVIKNMLEVFDMPVPFGRKPVSAVGGKTYMTVAGTHCPSFGNFKRDGSGLLRRESTGIMRVDVLMAIKLMSPEAYNVDYMYDKRGEDIGWSRNCRENGLAFAWDGRIASKHIMKPEQLYQVDKRVGW